MGIIETIKKIEREEGFEIGMEKGIEKGMEKGREKGIEEGLEKGMERGMEKGIEMGKREVIENLITKLGLSDKQVSDIAEMPVSFVKKVRASLKNKR